MKALFEALGIDGTLLFAQSINFALVVIVLSVLVYRPLLRMMKERKERIESGLLGAQEAEKRLRDIDVLRKEITNEANKQAALTVSEAQQKALKRSHDIIARAENKGEEMMRLAHDALLQQKEKELALLNKEAHSLIRNAIAKATSQDPVMVDEALIKRAAQILQKHNTPTV